MKIYYLFFMENILFVTAFKLEIGNSQIENFNCYFDALSAKAKGSSVETWSLCSSFCHVSINLETCNSDK